MRARLLGLFLTAVAATALVGCGGKDDNAAPQTSGAGAVPFDRAFIDGMVPHHEGAIAMARAAQAAGLTQPDLRKLAGDIVAAQQLEIDDMLGWRQAWFGSSEIDPAGAEPLGLSETEMGMQHDSDFSTEADVDQAFSTMMIDHHRGAIRMAELALERGEHQEIKDLAKAIVTAQEREIAVMENHATGMHHDG